MKSDKDQPYLFLLRAPSSEDVLRWATESMLTLSVDGSVTLCVWCGEGGVLDVQAKRVHELGLASHIRLCLASGIQEIDGILANRSALMILEGSEYNPVDAQLAKKNGLPMIVLEGSKEEALIENGITGFVVPASRPDRLAWCMERLSMDRELCERMSAKVLAQGSNVGETLAAISPAVTEGEPLVSIVIPCYNHREFILMTLASVVAQTYRNWECVVVNDGSTDDSEQVILSFIAEHPKCRIRIVNKENGGSSSARNVGVRSAAGDWILPLDGDDLLAPIALEVLVQKAMETGADLVYPNTQVFGAQVFTAQQGPFQVDLLKQANRLPYCTLYHRRVYNAVGGYNENQFSYEDWNFWIGVAKRGFRGEPAQQVLFFYRTLKKSKYTMALQNHEKIVSQIIENHAELYSADVVARAKEYLKVHGYYDSRKFRKLMESR